MNSLFSIGKAIPLYIKMFTNKVDVLRLDTGKSISRPCSTKEKFSSERVVIFNFNKAEVLLRSAIREVIPSGSSIFSPSLNIVIQQMEKNEGGLADHEKRALKDLCEHAGAQKVQIVERQGELTQSEAILELKNKKLTTTKSKAH